MEKILFVTNGHLLNTRSVDFACYLAQRTRSGLTGMFLEEDQLELVPPFESELSYFKKTKERRSDTNVIMDVDQGMRYFLQECETKSVRAEVYHHIGNAVDDIVHESRFADLLVFGPEMIFNPLYNQVPPPAIKEAFTKVECPVVVAPTLFEDIDNIVFCYDGSRSSVFALKQFTYLLPHYADKNVIVLEVEKHKTSITEKDKLNNWLRCYYPQVAFDVLEGAVDDEIFKYFFMKERTFVVMGAYGRNLLSNFMHHSAADTVLRTIDLPLFIAHH